MKKRKKEGAPSEEKAIFHKRKHSKCPKYCRGEAREPVFIMNTQPRLSLLPFFLLLGYLFCWTWQIALTALCSIEIRPAIWSSLLNYGGLKLTGWSWLPSEQRKRWSQVVSLFQFFFLLPSQQEKGDHSLPLNKIGNIIFPNNCTAVLIYETRPQPTRNAQCYNSSYP